MKRGLVKSSASNAWACCSCCVADYATDATSHHHYFPAPNGSRVASRILKCKYVLEKVKREIQAMVAVRRQISDQKKRLAQAEQMASRVLHKRQAARGGQVQASLRQVVGRPSARCRRLGTAAARMICCGGLPFRFIDSHLLRDYTVKVMEEAQSMVINRDGKALLNFDASVRLMSRFFLTNEALPQVCLACCLRSVQYLCALQLYQQMKDEMIKELQLNAGFGYTISIDGLTNIAHHHLVNIVLQGPGGAFCYKIVDVTQELRKKAAAVAEATECGDDSGSSAAVVAQNAPYFAGIVNSAISELQEAGIGVCQLLSDSPSVHKKMWSLVQRKYPTMITGSCLPHKLNSIMKEIGGMTYVAGVIASARAIVKLVTRSDTVRRHMHVIQPGARELRNA